MRNALSGFVTSCSPVVAAVRSASWSESIGGFGRLDSRLFVFKSQRRVFVVLTVPVYICHARSRRVETHVRACVRISLVFREGNANVRIHGDRFSGSESNGVMRQAKADRAPDIPSAGPRAKFHLNTLDITRHA
jgi:hypothetical protein